MALNFDAGRLRQRVEVLARTDTPDGAGGYTASWAVVKTVWTEVIGLAGRESQIAGALTGVTPFRITVRHDDGKSITTSHQLRHDGRKLNIRSINDPDGRRRWLTLVCDNEGVE